MTPAELREKRNSELTHAVKLPVSEDILMEMRSRLWDDLSWSDNHKESRMKYLGCMWGFEMGARVGEHTRAEPAGSDHCNRIDDLTFVIETPGATKTASGMDVVNFAAGLKQITAQRSLFKAGPYGKS